MSNVNIQTTISPYTQEPVCTRPLLSQTELDNVISEAVKAQKAWRKVPLDDRIAIAEKWVVSDQLSTLGLKLEQSVAITADESRPNLRTSPT
jgi:hypothetical protein